MPATFEYAKKVIIDAEKLGFDTTLIAELYLNDIKGMKADTLEAWSTAAALAAVTEKIEIMTAVRPLFHNPAVTAKMAANIDQISNGRFTLNIVSGWWEGEAKQYNGSFTSHEERYARTEEFIDVLTDMWREDSFTFEGDFYAVEKANLAPKPVQSNGPKIYAGGESDLAKTTIATYCDSYVMHGGSVAEVKAKIEEMNAIRKAVHPEQFQTFGMAAYVIVRDTEEDALQELERITKVEDLTGYAGFKDFKSKSKLEQEISLRDYSVSNRGLRPHLVGTAEQVAARINAYEKVGVDLLLLQFSPQLEEMHRFAEEVMPLVKNKSFVSPEGGI